MDYQYVCVGKIIRFCGYVCSSQIVRVLGLDGRQNHEFFLHVYYSVYLTITFVVFGLFASSLEIVDSSLGRFSLDWRTFCENF